MKNSVDDDNEYGYHGHEYTLYDGAARSGGYDHSHDYDGGYSKSDDSHGYGNKLLPAYYLYKCKKTYQFKTQCKDDMVISDI